MNINQPFLNRINPVTKLILMTIATIVVSFAYDIYTPLLFFICIFILSSIYGEIQMSVLIKKMMKFILVGISFGIFILGSRLLVGEGASPEVMITAISLCLRIMVFSLTSIVFVLTTDPNELGLSLIHQCKISHRIIYPFLVAYRFIPTFKDELEKIILAKEVRGISSDKGWVQSIINLPRYLLPLLTSAVRKGERVSMSMESRGFGAHEERTYYKHTIINEDDYRAIGIFILISFIIIGCGLYLGLIKFRLGLVIK